MPQPKPGGYIWKREIVRGKRSVATARSFAQRILEERPGPALAAVYLANIAVQLGAIAEVLDTLATIVDDSRDDVHTAEA